MNYESYEELKTFCAEVFQISAIDFSKIFPNFTGHEIQGKTSPILLIKTELFNE